MENFKMILLLKVINEAEHDTEDSKLLLNKYEIDKENFIKLALKEDYIKIHDIQQGTVKELKEILKNAGLVQTGNKEALIQRVTENISEDELKKYFGNDKYKLTPLGRKFLKDNIEEFEKELSETGEEEKIEIVEELPVEEKIEENPIENIEEVEIEEEITKEPEEVEEIEVKEDIIKEEIKEEVKEKTEEKIEEEKIPEHKDKFAKNYIIAGVVIIAVVVFINMFL